MTATIRRLPDPLPDCPTCHNYDGIQTLGGQSWAYCRRHRVRWRLGHPAFAVWRRRSDADRGPTTDEIRGYRVVPGGSEPEHISPSDFVVGLWPANGDGSHSPAPCAVCRAPVVADPHADLFTVENCGVVCEACGRRYAPAALEVVAAIRQLHASNPEIIVGDCPEGSDTDEDAALVRASCPTCRAPFDHPWGPGLFHTRAHAFVCPACEPRYVETEAHRVLMLIRRLAEVRRLWETLGDDDGSATTH